MDLSSIPIATERRTPQRPRFPDRAFHADDAADYTEEEWNFCRAMERYKRENRRPFPTWREVLSVVHGVGYRLPGEEGRAAA